MKIIHLNRRIRGAIHFLKDYDKLYVSKGLSVHVAKRHRNCLKYLNSLQQIVLTADYIGQNPNENGTSFELVKKCNDIVLVAIKLDIFKDRLYVASVYEISDSKLQRGIENGRFRKI